MIEVTVLDVCK